MKASGHCYDTCSGHFIGRLQVFFVLVLIEHKRVSVRVLILYAVMYF